MVRELRSLRSLLFANDAHRLQCCEVKIIQGVLMNATYGSEFGDFAMLWFPLIPTVFPVITTATEHSRTFWAIKLCCVTIAVFMALWYLDVCKWCFHSLCKTGIKWDFFVQIQLSLSSPQSCREYAGVRTKIINSKNQWVRTWFLTTC